MEDVLGITTALVKHKMNLLLKQLNENTDSFDDYIVYSWGKNDKGQLCLNPSASVTVPIKLKLPEHTEIFACLSDHTLLKNTKTQQITINTLDEHNKLKWEPLTNNKVWVLAASKSTLVYCESMGGKQRPPNAKE
jgi:alpha-tubulin suppressor-like RCC1 family protein